MRKINYFSAQEAKQQVENGSAFLKSKERQAKLVNNITDIFYRKINRAMKKGELSVIIKLGETTGIFFTTKHWKYHFNELSDESVKKLTDSFETRGFHINFPGIKVSNEPFVWISWEYGQKEEHFYYEDIR